MPEPADEVDEDFLVDPDNDEAVNVFLRCYSQWLYGAKGGVIGMNYPGVKNVLDYAVPKRRRREVFEALQIMEQSALAVFNKT